MVPLLFVASNLPATSDIPELAGYGKGPAGQAPALAPSVQEMLSSGMTTGQSYQQFVAASIVRSG